MESGGFQPYAHPVEGRRGQAGGVGEAAQRGWIERVVVRTRYDVDFPRSTDWQAVRDRPRLLQRSAFDHTADGETITGFERSADPTAERAGGTERTAAEDDGNIDPTADRHVRPKP